MQRFCTNNIHFKLKPLHPTYLSFFSSYLSQCSQAVCMDGEWFPLRQTVCGVLQGCILGTHLFLVAINDLPRVLALLLMLKLICMTIVPLFWQQEMYVMNCSEWWLMQSIRLKSSSQWKTFYLIMIKHIFHL